ncbi:hypothetical protein DB345_12340 [Spartobacteria bacterium LR76]|nr:hypothetical protein DB345_12340 [Spartobacteria bacterium LR76]
MHDQLEARKAEAIPYTAFLEQNAPQSKNFDDLLGKCDLEFGKKHPSRGVFQIARSRYDAGQIIPKKFHDIIESIGTETPKAESTPALAAEAAKPLTPPAVVSAPIASTPSKPAAKAMPAPVAPAPVRAEHLPKVSMATLGKTVNALMTDPNPSVRQPVIEGIQKGLEASKLIHRAEFDKLSPQAKIDYIRGGGKITNMLGLATTTADKEQPNNAKPVYAAGEKPSDDIDFSFISDFVAKRKLRLEFEENRGLTCDSWLEWMRFRHAYFASVGGTTEEMMGRAIVIPSVVIESKKEVYDREEKWKRQDAYFVEKLASLRAELEQAQKPGNSSEWDSRRRERVPLLERAIQQATSDWQNVQKKRVDHHATENRRREERFTAMRKALY